MALKVISVLCFAFNLYRIALCEEVPNNGNRSYTDYAKNLIHNLMDGYNPDVRPSEKTTVSCLIVYRVLYKYIGK